MKQIIFKYVVALLAAAALAGCSLLKFSVSTGDPIPKEDMKARVMTRGFYYDMTAEIIRTADSIASAAPDGQTRIRAIRWKMKATRAAADAALQSIPEVALADTWILCRRMNDAFASTPDSLLFGAQTLLARSVVQRLDKRAAALAREVLTPDRYKLMERFVTNYVVDNPADNELATTNTTLAWLQFLKSNGIEHAYATGTISEVIADMNDRVGGQTQQMSRSLGWSKDIFELQLEQDSTRTRLGQQLDSLERNFSRMVTVVEHMPEISDHVIQTLNKQVQGLIWTMNASVESAFEQIDRQREELQVFIDQEREATMRDASQAADRAVQTLLDGLPGVVGKIVFWLILLTVVVLGLPFAAGFWLGGLRERVRERKKRE